MTDYSDLKTVTDCRSMQAELRHTLIGAEEVERVSKSDMWEAIRTANRVRWKMARLKRRLQDVCLHPLPDIKVTYIYGFTIATCKVCDKMIETKRDAKL